MIVSKRRYLHAFGGINYANESPDKELIRTFDHLKPLSAWRVLKLNRPWQTCSYKYGLVTLSSQDSILVFGGFN